MSILSREQIFEYKKKFEIIFENVIFFQKLYENLTFGKTDKEKIRLLIEKKNCCYFKVFIGSLEWVSVDILDEALIVSSINIL